jgi:hypothetical protein
VARSKFLHGLEKTRLRFRKSPANVLSPNQREIDMSDIIQDLTSAAVIIGFILVVLIVGGAIQ